MKRDFPLLSALTCLMALTTAPSLAADVYTDPDALYQTSGLRGSIGLRYWYSQSSSELTRGSTELTSSDGVTAHTAELVTTLVDTDSNAFFRGMVGIGRNTSGDFDLGGAPAGDLDATSIGYVTIDGGWQFAQFAGNQARLKGFFGYHFLSDDLVINRGSTTWEQDRKYHAIRVGLGAEGDIGSRAGWSVDVAGVPWTYNKVGEVEAKYAYGLEADAMLNVDLTRNWQVGVGGRYWWYTSSFREERPFNRVDEYDHTYHRYGLLLESSYTF